MQFDLTDVLSKYRKLIPESQIVGAVGYNYVTLIDS